MRYILWVVALRETYDLTKNGDHLSRHLEFCQELKIR